MFNSGRMYQLQCILFLHPPTPKIGLGLRKIRMKFLYAHHGFGHTSLFGGGKEGEHLLDPLRTGEHILFASTSLP